MKADIAIDIGLERLQAVEASKAGLGGEDVSTTEIVFFDIVDKDLMGNLRGCSNALQNGH